MCHPDIYILTGPPIPDFIYLLAHGQYVSISSTGPTRSVLLTFSLKLYKTAWNYG